MTDNTALLVAEAPWFDLKDRTGQASGVPFFEGVQKLLQGNLRAAQFNVYNANYYDTRSLKHCLNHLLEAKENHQILYFGGHGDGRKVGEANLKLFVDYVRDNGSKVKGLIISSCFAGSSDKVSEASMYGLDGLNWVSGPNWIMAYRYAVNWMESALIETAVIHAFSEAYLHGEPPKAKSTIIDTFCAALNAFNPKAYIASSRDERTDHTIEDTLRVWARGQGATEPTEITEEIFQELSERSK